MEIVTLVRQTANVAKLAAHGVSWLEIEALVAVDEWVALRHDAYPDQVRVIGRTPAGRVLTIVMEPTEDPAAWRPVTGWPSSPAEVSYYGREAR